MSAVLPNTARFGFVPMKPSDLDAVLAVEQRVYAFPWTRGNFVDSLASGYSSWLMRDGEGMLGYAVMMLVLDEAHLLNISIVPERQQAGFGSVLLEHLFAVARSQAAVRMLLEVRPSNVAARAFYDRHGFVGIGERPGYYPAHQGREAALVMVRSL
ncbi:MAG: ribosomal protein S18-alanine N-acetyltransferase [Sterolibacterium sp.]|nr:ribosomal protein S18-alanine N-acetyltransferase [Sterolibacterium sp.]